MQLTHHLKQHILLHSIITTQTSLFFKTNRYENSSLFSQKVDLSLKVFCVDSAGWLVCVCIPHAAELAFSINTILYTIQIFWVCVLSERLLLCDYVRGHQLVHMLILLTQSQPQYALLCTCMYSSQLSCWYIQVFASYM